MTNCYVCSFVPHHANSNPFWTPEPENEINTLCMVANWTLSSTGPSSDISKWLPNCTVSQDLKEWRNPRNYSKKTNNTNFAGIAPARYPTKPLFCFSRACDRGTTTKFLGTSDCKEILPVATDRDQNKGVWHSLYSGSSPTRFCNESICNLEIAPINWTAASFGQTSSRGSSGPCC